MKTRATITIEPEILNKTKGLARTRQTNVSSLIENLLVNELEGSENITKHLIGSAEVRDGKLDSRHQRLADKYLHG